LQPARTAPSSLSTTLVVFGAGAVLMALEMLAFRVVAKNFGSALREVSAVIAVFLTAMSAGYALGGRIGDWRPSPWTLAAVLTGAGLLTLLIPLIEGPVAAAIFDSSLPLGLHAAVVAIALFALPAGLIASVTPIAIRLRMRSVDSSGSVAGNMSALSTVGSILGTLAGGYVLLAYLQLSRGLFLLGLLLCGLGLVAARSSRALGCVALALLLLADPVAGDQKLLFEQDTSYHHIQVREGPERRTLHFDRTLQGSMSLTDPLKGAIPYVYHVHHAFVIAPEIRSVLVIGLGSASIPRHILHYYPETRVTVAEIDPVVVEVARNHFSLPQDERLRVEIADGRVFIKRTQERYDLIVVDAFGANRYGLTIPPHLTTREFLEEAKRRLTPPGLLAYNAPRRIGTPLAESLYKTLAAVFPEVYIFETHDYLSSLMIAAATPRKLTRDDLLARGRAAMERGTVPHLLDRLETLRPPPSLDSLAAPLLTDDYAPVDRLIRGQLPAAGGAKGAPE
jgi:spermidine synthase